MMTAFKVMEVMLWGMLGMLLMFLLAVGLGMYLRTRTLEPETELDDFSRPETMPVETQEQVASPPVSSNLH